MAILRSGLNCRKPSRLNHPFRCSCSASRSHAVGGFLNLWHPDTVRDVGLQGCVKSLMVQYVYYPTCLNDAHRRVYKPSHALAMVSTNHHGYHCREQGRRHPDSDSAQYAHDTLSLSLASDYALAAYKVFYPILEQKSAEILKVQTKTFKYGSTDRHQVCCLNNLPGRRS